MNALMSKYDSCGFSTRNRIVLAPLTRGRATCEQVPTDTMKTFYLNRASAGLLIAEACSVSRAANCYPHVPGIYTDLQRLAWKKITSALKEKEAGIFFLQLWHPGMMGHQRVSHSMPLSPSGIKPKRALAPIIHLPYDEPKIMDREDFAEVMQSFCSAAQNAIDAGFCGVELHAAYGYLLSSFLHHQANHRTDKYGGSLENMCRFPLEVIDAVIHTLGDSKKVAVRISPVPPKSMGSFDPHPKDEAVYEFFLKELSQRNLAYLDCASDDDANERGFFKQRVSEFSRKHFQGTLIVGGNYSIEEADRAIRLGHADLVYFGRPYLAKADLVDKIQQGSKDAFRAFEPWMITHPDGCQNDADTACSLCISKARNISKL